MAAPDTARPPMVRVIGEVMVDVLAQVPHLPVTGSDTAATISQAHGGSGANLAAWIARLGSPVELVARVGDDTLGDDAVRELEASGVHLRIGRDDHAPTGRCIVIVTPDGERTMLPDPGANALLGPADLAGLSWQDGDLLHVSGYCLLREGPRVAVLDAMSAARSLGIPVSVDASSAAPLEGVGAETVLGWLREGDLLFANADEACTLAATTDPQAAADVLAQRGLVCVVKLGAEGALAALPGGHHRVAAAAVHVVDTTGAGDAFAAGFLASWRGSRDIEPALRHGASTAARAVAQRGARP